MQVFIFLWLKLHSLRHRACFRLVAQALNAAVLRLRSVKEMLGLPSPAIANEGKAASVEAMTAAVSPGKPLQTFVNPPPKPPSQTARQRRAAERRSS